MRINWSSEEMILAADVADDLHWRGVNAKVPQVVKLSALLRSAQYHPPKDRDENFRSSNSVGLKINNLRSSHPGHTGAGLRISEAETWVVELFVSDRLRMKRVATRLRGQIDAGEERIGDAKRFIAE